MDACTTDIINACSPTLDVVLVTDVLVHGEFVLGTLLVVVEVVGIVLLVLFEAKDSLVLVVVFAFVDENVFDEIVGVGVVLVVVDAVIVVVLVVRVKVAVDDEVDVVLVRVSVVVVCVRDVVV